jgi:hypothetical protein
MGHDLSAGAAAPNGAVAYPRGSFFAFSISGSTRIISSASRCSADESRAHARRGVLRQGHHLALQLARLRFLVRPPPQGAGD